MSLQKLLAMQAAKKVVESKTPEASTPPVATPAEAESEKVTQAPEKPKGLGLNLAGKSQLAKATTLAAALPKAPESKPSVIDSAEFSLEDLAALDGEEVMEESREGTTSEFLDEIEATAPDRDLPPDVTPEMLSFVESLDGIYGMLHDAEMFGQTTRIIMMELAEHKEYEKLLSDSDIHVMLRGMRRTMGLARVRKQEKSRKGRTNTAARKKSGVSDDNMALLDSLMGGSGD